MFSVEALLCCLYYGITEVLIFITVQYMYDVQNYRASFQGF